MNFTWKMNCTFTSRPVAPQAWREKRYLEVRRSLAVFGAATTAGDTSTCTDKAWMCIQSVSWLVSMNITLARPRPVLASNIDTSTFLPNVRAA